MGSQIACQASGSWPGGSVLETIAAEGEVSGLGNGSFVDSSSLDSSEDDGSGSSGRGGASSGTSSPGKGGGSSSGSGGGSSSGRGGCSSSEDPGSLGRGGASGPSSSVASRFRLATMTVVLGSLCVCERRLVEILIFGFN